VFHRRPDRIRHRLGDRRRRRLVRRPGHSPGTAGGFRRCARAICPRHPGKRIH
jgi:hypothetical protein